MVAPRPTAPSAQARPPFSPELISPGLRLGVRDELTAGQLETAAAAIGRRTDEEIIGSLDLNPLQQNRARWWLTGVRDALIDLALRYLSGNLHFLLDQQEVFAHKFKNLFRREERDLFSPGFWCHLSGTPRPRANWAGQDQRSAENSLQSWRPLLPSSSLSHCPAF